MEWVKLGDIAEIISGSTPKTSETKFWGGNLPWITPAELVESKKYVYSTERQITDLAVKASNLKIIPANSILLTSRAPIGKVAINKISLYTNQGFKSIVPSPEILNVEYMYYWLRNHNELLQHLGNGATFKEISKKVVEGIDILLPSLEIQKCIVSKLSCLETLIAKRREQIDTLDMLVGSVFNELEKTGGEKVKLKELTKINPQKSEVKELDPNTAVSFVPMEDVSEAGELILSQERALGEVYKGFTYFKDGDVVVAKITPCFENGKGALMRGLVNGIGFGTTEFHVLRAKDSSRLNPVWLFNVTRSKRFNAYGEMQMTGSAGQKRIPKNFLEDYEITLPPIALQNRFADYVTSIEAQKETLRASLSELETLFDALMQKAFSGHLN